MRSIVKKIISCIIVMIMLFCVMAQCTKIAQNKVSYRKTAPFFEYKDDFDVLFLGTSHVKLGVLPMELWNDYGITSYNFGCSSSHLPTTYWIMKNALDYSKPKVIVIDCWGLSQSTKTDETFAYVHEAFDAFPLTVNKIRASFDLVDDPAETNTETNTLNEKHTKMGLLWNYSVYHKRWTELGHDDFEPRITINYGGELRPFICRPTDLAENDGSKCDDINAVGIQYLERMIRECKENNIEVLLTYFPYSLKKETDWSEINTVYDIADKYDIKYVNFFDEDIINYNTDLADSTHLNPSGAWKVTDYLGGFLTENYRLNDHRTDAGYEHWNKDYEEYAAYKEDLVKAATDLNTYLMMLKDKELGYDVEIGDREVLRDRVTAELLNEKGKSVEAGDYEENARGRIKVNVFRISDPDNTIDSSVFARPQNIDIPEEYINRYATSFEIIDENKINIVYYELYNPDNVINTVTMTIPQGLGFEDNLPNTLGTVFQNSMAVRVSD